MQMVVCYSIQLAWPVLLVIGAADRPEIPATSGFYQSLFAAAALLVLIEAIAIVLLVARARRRPPLLQPHAQAESLDFTQRLLAAQETERRRIARELHDDFGQNLALLSVQIDLLKRAPPATLEPMESQIEAICAQVKQLSTSIHELSHQLHPMKLEQLGLVAALGALCSALGRSGGMKIEFSHRDIPTLPQSVATCLYRIAQEALSNAVRHSGARRTTVVLTTENSEIQLRIRDDGKGFNPTAAENQIGLGLISMRERLRAVDGEIAFNGVDRFGTQIDVTVPLTKVAAQDDILLATRP